MTRGIRENGKLMNYPAASNGVSKNVMPVQTGIHYGFPLSRK